MLRELHISNLAVIEDMTIELAPGLNCFTGQTGAGKSLIIGAFELLLGLRSGGAGDMLRPGAEEARVSGVFEVDNAEVASMIAAVADAPIEPDEPLLITRKIYASGRTSVSVNGRPATAPMVRAIGELLVDVHGQHDHQYLLRPSNQLTVLDAFGRSTDLRERFSELHGEIASLQRRSRELSASDSLRRQQLELYEFQAQEIDTADPLPGEYAELKARHAMLSNLQKLKRDAGHAHAALYDSEGSIIERLQMLTHLLIDMAELDDEVREISEQVKSSTLSLQEASFELARYLDRLDQDPGELAEIEDRLDTLNRLLSKYGSNRRRPGGRREPEPVSRNDDPVAEVIAYRQEIERQLVQLRGDSEDCGRIDDRIAELSSELETVGRDLSAKRQAAAKRIKPLVEAELKELGMAEAEFSVGFEDESNGRSAERGVPSPESADETVSAAIASDSPSSDSDPNSPLRTPHPELATRNSQLPSSSSGFDVIEMLVRTNPGQPARPLRKVASGGELSRIMLALKSILAHSDRISVLVFDEIDSNIGGRMGTVIGRKLRELAGGIAGLNGKQKPKKREPASGLGGAGGSDGHHQILCITHLPQIAAFADRHMRIAKAVAGKGDARQTRTTVTRLDGKERIEELAEMLAGKDVTTTTRKQVEEMIEAVR